MYYQLGSQCFTSVFHLGLRGVRSQTKARPGLSDRALLTGVCGGAVVQIQNADLGTVSRKCLTLHSVNVRVFWGSSDNPFIRPPDLVDGLRFYSDSSSIFFPHLPSELAERNLIKAGYTLGSNCDLKTHVPNLAYPILLQIGSPKTNFFDDFAT